ncbi:MAG: ATP-binding protein [Treponema sp.]|nr:ATP-binding protein [Treponema sp.]
MADEREFDSAEGFEAEGESESSLSKSNFLARMSHEMRTPLNAIIGMSTIAQSSKDQETIKNCLSRINEASIHLLGMINEVLDMAKIEAGNLKLSQAEFDFPQMLKKAAETRKFTLDAKKQNLVLDFDPGLPENLISDEQRLFQVLDNLLSNAVKFTPPEGTITLSVKKLKEEGQNCTLRFEVRDTGIGITDEAKENIFSLFEQADGGMSRRFEGAGLGLAISSGIVKLLGSRLSVESEYTKGSCFSFEVTLEMGKKKAQEAPQEEDLSGKYEGYTIILAEDVEINREIALALLEDTGVVIDCAENGLEALELYKGDPEKYSLILMDIHMPEMDGLESSRQIRAFEEEHPVSSGGVTIIAMTANVFKEDVENCLAAGMNAHLGKPVDYDELINQLDTYLLKKS